MLAMNKISKSASVCCVLLVTAFFISPFLQKIHLQRKVNQSLKKISQEDRDTLRTFFYNWMMIEGTAGYTLFGNKPISVIGYLNESPAVLLGVGSSVMSKNTAKGYEIWEKYSHLFPSKKYAMIRVKAASWVSHIFLVSKQSCYKVVNNNIDCFKQFADDEIPVHEQVIQHLLLATTWPSFTQSQIGLLFGFGRKNALAFDRSDEIRKKAWAKAIDLPSRDNRNINAIRKKEVQWLPRIAQPNMHLDQLIQPSSGFESLGEEYDTLRGSKASHKKYSPNWVAERILLPQFVPTSGEELEGSETDQLVKGYRETRKKLMKLAKSKHFLRDLLVEWIR